LNYIQNQRLLDEIISRHRINVDLTEKLDLNYLNEDTRLFSVKWGRRPTKVYILDTIEGSEIACKPEIVGAKFIELNSTASREAAKIIARAIKPKMPIIYLHVLRASLGYMLHESLKKEGLSFHEAYVRPKYILNSYRNHRERKVVINYRRYCNVSSGDYCLIVADTIATGRTLIESIRDLYVFLNDRDARIEEVILYGFIAIEGLRKLENFLYGIGVNKIYVIAMQDLAPLASNLYDMPLYGPDESLWGSRGEINFLGAVADYETVERMFHEYAPGMDQPGDWSERQIQLYNGVGYERGNMRNHLRKSLKILKNLYQLAKSKNLYDRYILDIYSRRIASITDALNYMV